MDKLIKKLKKKHTVDSLELDIFFSGTEADKVVDLLSANKILPVEIEKKNMSNKLLAFNQNNKKINLKPFLKNIDTENNYLIEKCKIDIEINEDKYSFEINDNLNLFEEYVQSELNNRQDEIEDSIMDQDLSFEDFQEVEDELDEEEASQIIDLITTNKIKISENKKEKVLENLFIKNVSALKIKNYLIENIDSENWYSIYNQNKSKLIFSLNEVYKIKNNLDKIEFTTELKKSLKNEYDLKDQNIILADQLMNNQDKILNVVISYIQKNNQNLYFLYDTINKNSEQDVVINQILDENKNSIAFDELFKSLNLESISDNINHTLKVLSESDVFKNSILNLIIDEKYRENLLTLETLDEEYKLMFQNFYLDYLIEGEYLPQGNINKETYLNYISSYKDHNFLWSIITQGELTFSIKGMNNDELLSFLDLNKVPSEKIVSYLKNADVLNERWNEVIQSFHHIRFLNPVQLLQFSNKNLLNKETIDVLENRFNNAPTKERQLNIVRKFKDMLLNNNFSDELDLIIPEYEMLMELTQKIDESINQGTDGIETLNEGVFDSDGYELMEKDSLVKVMIHASMQKQSSPYFINYVYDNEYTSIFNEYMMQTFLNHPNCPFYDYEKDKVIKHKPSQLISDLLNHSSRNLLLINFLNNESIPTFILKSIVDKLGISLDFDDKLYQKILNHKNVSDEILNKIVNGPLRLKKNIIESEDPQYLYETFFHIHNKQYHKEKFGYILNHDQILTLSNCIIENKNTPNSVLVRFNELSSTEASLKKILHHPKIDEITLVKYIEKDKTSKTGEIYYDSPYFNIETMLGALDIILEKKDYVLNTDLPKSLLYLINKEINNINVENIKEIYDIEDSESENIIQDFQLLLESNTEEIKQQIIEGFIKKAKKSVHNDELKEIFDSLESKRIFHNGLIKLSDYEISVIYSSILENEYSSVDLIKEIIENYNIEISEIKYESLKNKFIEDISLIDEEVLKKRTFDLLDQKIKIYNIIALKDSDYNSYIDSVVNELNNRGILDSYSIELENLKNELNGNS